MRLALVCVALTLLAACAPEPKTASPAPEPSPETQPEPAPTFQEVREHFGETRTVVLTYHDIILQRGPDSVWFDTTLDEFTDQIDTLQARGANFISAEQLYRHLVHAEPIPPKAVLITFSDNYLGFYQHALPILRERQIPTIMFVHTDFVGSPIGRPKMNWSQLRELQDEGLVAIGSQTRTHPPDLTALPPDQLREEMVGSKAALERELNTRIDFFAYPGGKYNQAAAEAAREAGYLMAFTEQRGIAESAPSILLVPRTVHTRLERAWTDAHPR